MKPCAAYRATKRAPDGRSGAHRRGRTCLVAPFPGRGSVRRFAAGPLQEREAFRTRGLSFYLPVPAILPVPARFLVLPRVLMSTTKAVIYKVNKS